MIAAALAAVHEALAQPALALLIATAAVAGLVRGFSGFGAAMVFVPVAAAVLGPPAAIVLLLLIDGVAALPLLPRAVRLAVWREVGPLAVASWITAPLGVALLAVLDPTGLRWAICLGVLAVVVVLAGGWRWRGRPSVRLSLGVGAVSGLTGGTTGLAGPPVVLFWLSGAREAAVVRANIIIFLAALDTALAVNLALRGLITAERLVTGAVLIPVFGAALWLGAHAFRGADDRLYRRVALGLCTAAALVGLPLWT